MKKLQLVEITTPYKPAEFDENGAIIEGTEIQEVSHVFEENGFRYEEDLCLSKVEPETTEKVIRKKNGEKVPTVWQTMSTEERENHYFGLRLNAYKSECDRLTAKYPGRIFVVKILE